MTLLAPWAFTDQGVPLPDWTIAQGGINDPVNNPMSCYRYMEGKRKAIIDAAHQRPLMRLWDENMQYLGALAQEKSVSVEEVMADSGAGQVVIRRDNWLSDFLILQRRKEQDVHFTLDPIPTQQSWRTRWGGKVSQFNVKRSPEGFHTVELELISNREHIKHLLCGANPVFPPEVQLPRIWLMPWNIRTGVFISLTVNLARQFFPLLAIPDNIANPAAWLSYGSAGILEGFNPLWWPIQPQYVDVVTDQSRFEILSARWTDFHSATTQILRDAGCIIRAYTWLTSDTESPHPDLGPKLGQIARPWRNCVILAVEDKSGITGPTGTFVDGFINAIASTGDNLITSILLPNYLYPDGTPMPLFAKWFGVAPAYSSWVVFRDGELSGITESTRTEKGSLAKTIMTGGKSPSWVNQLIQFGIKYALSQLSNLIVANVDWTATNWSQEVTGMPGLEEIYQGQLDDTILAYTRFTDPVRELYCGDFAFLEHFEQGAAIGWTVSTLLTLRDGDWKTRPYQIFKVSARNGAPYLLNVDYTLGDRISFEIGGVLHTDQIYSYKLSYDENTPVKIDMAVGWDTVGDDPFGSGMRMLAGLWNMFGAFMGAKDVF